MKHWEIIKPSVSLSVPENTAPTPIFLIARNPGRLIDAIYLMEHEAFTTFYLSCVNPDLKNLVAKEHPFFAYKMGGLENIFNRVPEFEMPRDMCGLYFNTKGYTKQTVTAFFTYLGQLVPHFDAELRESLLDFCKFPVLSAIETKEFFERKCKEHEYHLKEQQISSALSTGKPSSALLFYKKQIAKGYLTGSNTTESNNDAATPRRERAVTL